jgi:lipoprotein-releasing system permease protein
LIKIYHLSTAFDIAKKISFQKGKRYTRFIVNLSIAATAISVAAIILTLSVVNGFQESISDKVYQFWGHIRIATVDGSPIDTAIQFDSDLTQHIESITPLKNQSGVIAYQQDIEGVVVKGVPISSNIPFIIQGRAIQANKDSNQYEVILSAQLANKLKVPLDSSIRLYFLNTDKVEQRKMKVVGLYNSGIEEYDRQFIIVDLNTLQKINRNNPGFDAFTVRLKKGASIDALNDQFQNKIPKSWVATPIKDYFPQIFDWINVQTVNKNVTIVILLIIAIVNLLTCLFILMLERVNMIGTLTAMGASHSFIRQIFLYQASFICWIGIGIGLIIGVGLSYAQLYFEFIQLDEAAYFMSTLPIQMNWLEISWVIMGTAGICYISFLLPTIWIKKIAPAQAIKFD